MKKTLKKCIVLAIIFILTFVNYGFSIEVIATEGASVFNSSIFRKSSIQLKAYFDNKENETEKLSDVNKEVVITTELNPKVDGLLQDAILKLDLENSDNSNFEIVSVTKEGEEAEQTIAMQQLSKGVDTNLKASTDFTADDSNTSNEENLTTETSNSENTSSQNTVGFSEDENQVTENNSVNEEVSNVVEENTNTNETATDNTQTAEENEVEDEMIDEEKVIEAVTKEANEEKQSNTANSEINITSSNEISLQNILTATKLNIVIKYKQGETVNIEDLYKKLNVSLTGTFIDTDLEEIEVSEVEDLTLGWEYSKEIEIASEYTKVSPFSIGENTGTIVENQISVKREITDNNYLPLKETNIKIQVPELKGKLPIAISVNANKLMATKGEEFGAVDFSENNWKYDENSQTIEISVKNENNGVATNTKGEDVYVVTYRYEDYIEDPNVQLGKDIVVKVEEYSGIENKTQEKSIKTEQEQEINVGELITYSVGTTEDRINKGTINANYYSETQYETEFKTIVNLNILTSDMLENITVSRTKETYLDKDGNEFSADNDVMYKGVNFNYQEIRNILEQGNTIDLLDADGNILYTMNKDNTNSDETAKILLSENTKNLQVRINSIGANGNITIEFVKVIGKSAYTAAEFSEFKTIKSSVRAYVKYTGREETFSLKELETEKSFSESYTRAKISINKDYLTTIQENENVEIKIELNNEQETSDLYKNPYFEIVFPNYIKSVEIQSMNLLYENGLRVGDFQTDTRDGNVKLRVELQGTQKAFSDGELLNSTSIIINCKIVVDEVTPKKEDQIKLYYCNEAVTNYESQTKWSINKQTPSDIIKATNGFDVEVFEYQAPTGMVAVNTIKNYDGNSSEVKSVKQGTITKEISREKASQIAQMQLTTLNNTGNDCTDVTLVGRIPFKGNKVVTNNEELGTTTDTVMKDIIKADNNNSVSSTIYYSTNPDANKNLNDVSNGWTQEVANINEIKSYLIVVDGTVKAGDVLRYTYDFEIPENLPYEAGIYGTFSAYYNNNSDVAIVYESSTADKVGLTTEAGPKLEASLSVEGGNIENILEGKRINYIVKVNNIGSIDASNVVVNINIPDTAIYVKEIEESEEYEPELDSSMKNLKLDIGDLKTGESKEVTFCLQAVEKPGLAEYCETMGETSGQDDGGHYYTDLDNNKIYITEVPNYYIELKGIIETENIGTNIETNTLKIEIKDANFISSIVVKHDRNLEIGYESDFTTHIRNVSGKTLKNVKLTLHTNEYLQYESGECNIENTNINYNKENNTVVYEIDELENGVIVRITDKLKALNIPFGEENIDVYYEMSADGIETEYSEVIPQKIIKSYLTGEASTGIVNKQVKEEEEFTITIKVRNDGYGYCRNGSLYFEIPEVLEVESIEYTGDLEGKLNTGNGSKKIQIQLPMLKAQEEIDIAILLKANNITGTDNTNVSIEPKLYNDNQEDVNVNSIEFMVINDKLTESEQEAINQAQAEDEQNKQNEEDKANADKESISGQENNNNNNQENNSNNSSNNSNTGNDTNQNVNDSNNSNSNTNNGENTNNNQNNSEEQVYTIGGLAWIDENKDGVRNEEEAKLEGVKANLISVQDSKIVQTAETSSDGEYTFRNVSVGRYIITFEYDTNIYEPTIYRKNGTAEDVNSDVTLNSSSELAITDQITVNGDVANIDIGLITSNIFDLKINKYISHATVTVRDEIKEYDFDNKEIAKVEIRANELKYAKVDLEYTIVVENVGNIEGYVERLVDYLESGLTFNEEENSIWYLGNDGNLYTKNLDNTSLKPGEKREIKLVLSKQMTEENTGFVSNKVEIVSSYSNTNLNENTDNNVSIQNTSLSVATGRAVGIISTITIIAICAGMGYYIYIGKLKIPKISKKKVYK